jgi:hypothetical protein
LALAAGGAALAVRGATNRPLFAQRDGIDERMLPIRAEDASPDIGMPGTPTTASRTTA